MRHGSLFSGIGGFDLAAEWMGWENVFHCEWNPFGQKILKHYWPNAESFDDITKTDFTKYYGTIDLISGGFPCQPYSMAGKRLGKNDERHLWPEMLRAIKEISPRWVVGENVRGLTNWNGGLVFDEVCSDLENLGYQVAPYLIPASGVNAPHKRERIWFIAYRNASDTNCRGLERTIEVEWDSFNVERKSSIGNASDTDSNGNGTKYEFCSRGNVSKECVNKCGNASNTTSIGLCGNSSTKELQLATFGTRHGMGEQNASDTEGICLQGHSNGQRERKFRRGDWVRFPTQSPICSGDDGLPTELDGITFSKWRNESIKGYGNAVVPQVVFEIFKAIQTYERNEVNERRTT